MNRLIAGLPEQLRWASIIECPAVPEAETALVCGMGGSGIGGDFAAQAAADSGRLVLTHKSYGLPAWAASVRPLVIAASYSGNTEETLSAAAGAGDLGLAVAAVATGGMLAEMAIEKGWALVNLPAGLPPRAALGYQTGALVRLLHRAGILADPRRDLEESAGVIAELVGTDGTGAGASLAEDLADGLAGRVTIIHAAEGITAPPAQRWKAQLNENGKTAAWFSLYPELDHNEILGWDDRLTRRQVGIVALRDRDEHPRVAARFRLTAELAGKDAPLIGEVWSQGRSVLARMLSLAVVGDLVSVAVAERLGNDPMPYELIERLKARLAEEV